MFKWDGTDITDLVSECNIFEATYNKTTYWVIKKNKIESSEICLVRNGNTTVCLSDELKSIFGLKKVGTHWIRYNNKIKILIKPYLTSEGHVKEEINMKTVQLKDELMILQLQEIFTFRELLGITCSYMSSLVWRGTEKNGYPLSYYEPNMNLDDKKVIPATILNTVFVNTDLNEVVAKLIKVKSLDSMSEIVFNLGSQIENTIYRVDRDLIEHKTCILSRITHRLQSSLTHVL